MTPDEQIHFMCRYLDEDLNDQDLQLLKKQILSDPQSADLLAELALQQQLLKKLPSSELDTEIIQGKTETRNAPTSRSFKLLSYAACILITLGLIFFGWHSLSTLNSQQSLEALSATRNGKPIDAKRIFGDGKIVSLKDGENIRLAYSQNSYVNIFDASSFSLVNSSPKTLQLHGGQAEFAIEPDEPSIASGSVRVQTTLAEIETLGTHFKVNVNGDQTTVEVMEGSVRLTTAGLAQAKRIHAGMTAIVNANKKILEKTTEPTWIWGQGESCLLKRDYFFAKPVRIAQLIGTCDNEAEIYLNGQLVHTHGVEVNSWKSTFLIDLKDYFQIGQNQLLIKATNLRPGSYKGFICALFVALENDRTYWHLSDATWLAMPSDKKPVKFPIPTQGWQRAQEIGPLGIEPWGYRLNNWRQKLLRAKPK